LNYYGFSDQVPVKITLATTSRKKHPDYSYATLDKKRFFGYTRIGQIVIAEKEKALVDALFLPRYAGGLKGVLTCLKQGPIDRKKLIRYARQMKSSVLMMRLAIVAKMAGWRL
jgi:predicted transcriptional regulator of viral defense system